MGRFYCDYCDAFLTNDSAKGRKQHLHGVKHRELMKQFYTPYLADPRYAPAPGSHLAQQQQAAATFGQWQAWGPPPSLQASQPMPPQQHQQPPPL